MTPNAMNDTSKDLETSAFFLDKKEPECCSGVFQRTFQLRKITVTDSVFLAHLSKIWGDWLE